MRKTLGPVKLKKKQGRGAFIVNNKDNTPMVIDTFVIRRDPSSPTKIYVDIDFSDEEKYELVEKESSNGKKA